jgi:opacity protein-like surface antigen
MKQCRGIVVAAWLVATAGSAAAADTYYPQATPPAAEPYVQSGLYFRGDAGWSWLEVDDGNADLATFGVGIGFQWNPMFRTDLRFDYGIGTDGSVELADRFGTLTANGYIDIPLDFPITPYVGAGLGYGFVSTNVDDERALAAALMGGVSWDVSKFVAVDVGYRFRTIATDDSMFADDNARDHSVTAGLRFKF